AALQTELDRLRPAEIIYPGENSKLAQLLSGRNPTRTPPVRGPDSHLAPGAPLPGGAEGGAGPGWIVNGYDDWVFAPETAQFTLREHFKVAALDGFGLKDHAAAIGAAGAVLHYLTQHLRRDVAHLTRLSFYQRSDYLALDFTTLRHLEILEPLNREAPRCATLFAALNRTVTPMGAR